MKHWLCAWAVLLVVGRADAATLSKTPIRLVEHLGDASIQSPLQSIEATEQLAGVSKKTLLNVDFEKTSVDALGWPVSGGNRVQKGAFRYRGGRSHDFLVVLPVKPNRYYRVSRRIKTADPQIDFRILESKVAVRQPQTLNHPDDLKRQRKGRFVRVKDLVFVHQLPPALGPKKWTTSTKTILTSGQTQALILSLQDAEGVISARAVDVWLDDLRVDALSPSPTEELALLKSQDRLHGSNVGLGMAKHGQLLPVGDAEKVKAPFDRNFDFRSAILAPAPTTVSYEVRVPSQAFLTLSYALGRSTPYGASATFQVTVDGAPVFSKSIQHAKKNHFWNDARVDLGSFAGKTVRLALKTTGDARSFALWGAPVVDRKRNDADPPNLIVIAVDTLRADRLSLYGHKRKTSPNLDAVAKQSLVFDNAISTSNWTTSSFASMFTGYMPSGHEVIHRARSIAPALDTLPELLARSGRVTHGIAYKAYLYNMGFEQGFDTWFNVPSSKAHAKHNLEKAMAFLEAHGDQRFFLFLHFNDPHQPFNQPSPYDRKFNSAQDLQAFGISMPILIGTSNHVQGCRKCKKGSTLQAGFRDLGKDLYDGAIAYFDAQLGTFFDELKRRNIYDNSVIVFVSDHGESMWEHKHYFGHGGAEMVEPLIHVPWFIKPAGGQAEQRVTAPASLVDFLPTVLDTMRIPVPEGVNTRHAQRQPREFVVSENIKQHVLAVRTASHKYVLRHRPGRAATETLFDLKTDPGEQKNVIRAQPKVAAQLRQHAANYLVTHRRGPYVLVAGGEGDVSLDVASDKPILQVSSLIGPKAVISGKNVRFQGKRAGAIGLLARIEVADGATLTIKHRGQEESSVVRALGNLTSEQIGSLADLGTPSAYVLKGATPKASYAQKDSINADQLSTLKALGYVE